MLLTGLYAGLLGLVYLVLCFNVLNKRLTLKVGIGDGGHQQLTRAIRVHGNFAEYVPFALLLIALCEMAGYGTYLIHAMGATLLIGRILHAYGLNKSVGTSIPRFVGMVGTLTVLIVSAICLIITGVQAYM